MSATDELRRLLDESEIEHTDAEDGHTKHTWWSDGDHEIAACNSGERLAVYNLTPEQAVEATLGRGTCRLTDNGPWGYPYVCSACGASFDADVNGGDFNFCPNCGRRIEVDDG